MDTAIFSCVVRYISCNGWPISQSTVNVRLMPKARDKSAELDHVVYEMEMLVFSVVALLNQDKLSPVDRNLWIECFAIHSKNLNEFFSSKSFPKIT